MEYVISLRYTEITLKGKNRAFFEKKLVESVREALEGHEIKFSHMKRIKGRVFVYFDQQELARKAIEPLTKVFGVNGLCFGILVNEDTESIKNGCTILLDNLSFKTFRISTKRGNKSFHKNSNEIDREIGYFVQERYNKKVDLENYELEVIIEIFSGLVIVSVENFPGAGGLPLGTGGKVVVGTDYKNYELSAYYLMKKGCKVFFCGKTEPEFSFLHSYNFNNEFEFFKENDDISKLMEINSVKAFVVGCGAQEYVENKQYFPKDCLTLAPLVGMND